MISLLFPTRGRPEQLKRTVTTARETAKKPIDIAVYIDDDDLVSVPVAIELGISYRVGPRIRKRTQYWNEVLDLAKGDIYGQLNDDVRFMTPGWDEMIEEAFTEWPDRIGVVHGDHLGGYDGRDFGPHPFVHKRWVDIVGYFTPAHYSSDHGDTHLNDIANALGRRKFIPFVIEHMHFAVGKAELDDTYRDRLKDAEEDDPAAVYYAMLPERVEAARKLGLEMTPKRIITYDRFYGTRSAGECPKCHQGSTVFTEEGVACNWCGHRYKT